MLPSQFLKRFLFHASAATAFFGAATVLLESLIPGSVTPYLNPIPFAIFGLVGLAVSSCVPAERRSDSRWSGWGLYVLSTLAVLVSFAAFARQNGRLWLVVFVWFALALAVIVISMRTARRP